MGNDANDCIVTIEISRDRQTWPANEVPSITAGAHHSVGKYPEPTTMLYKVVGDSGSANSCTLSNEDYATLRAVCPDLPPPRETMSPCEAMEFIAAFNESPGRPGWKLQGQTDDPGHVERVSLGTTYNLHRDKLIQAIQAREVQALIQGTGVAVNPDRRLPLLDRLELTWGQLVRFGELVHVRVVEKPTQSEQERSGAAPGLTIDTEGLNPLSFAAIAIEAVKTKRTATIESDNDLAQDIRKAVHETWLKDYLECLYQALNDGVIGAVHPLLQRPYLAGRDDPKSPMWLVTPEGKVKALKLLGVKAREPADLYPIGDAADMWAADQYPDTPGGIALAREAWRTIAPPGQQHPRVGNKFVDDDNEYLFLARHWAAEELASCIAALEAKGLIAYISPHTCAPTANRAGALISKKATAELIAKGAHLDALPSLSVDADSGSSAGAQVINDDERAKALGLLGVSRDGAPLQKTQGNLATKPKAVIANPSNSFESISSAADVLNVSGWKEQARRIAWVYFVVQLGSGAAPNPNSARGVIQKLCVKHGLKTKKFKAPPEEDSIRVHVLSEPKGWRAPQMSKDDALAWRARNPWAVTFVSLNT